MNNVRPVTTFQVSVGIGAAVTIAGAAFIIAFVRYPEYANQLTFAAAVVGSMAAIFSSYYIAESMRLKLVFDIEQVEIEKTKAALRFSFTDDPYISQIIHRLDKHLKIHTRDHSEIPLAELREFPNADYPRFNTDIAYILGRLEVMCISIKRDVASEEACRDLLLSRTVLYYDLFKQHIKDKQKSFGKDIYENFEKTAGEWHVIRVKQQK